MLRSSVLLILLLLGGSSWAQFHDLNIRKISTIAEAQAYASRYGEVSFGLVNSELDVFLFDSVDVNNLKASVGKMHTLFARRTKFIKDTVITMMNIQMISFNEQLVTADSANMLIDSIMVDYEKGMNYWMLMKKYQSAVCNFDSGPVATDHLESRFGENLAHKRQSEIFALANPGRQLPMIIIIYQEAHPVPAFYAISYNVAG